MKKSLIIPFTLIFLIGAGMMSSNAQAVKYTLLPESTMTIEGTSTIHDWKCNVQTLNLEATINPAVLPDAQPTGSFIPSLSFTTPVESIECGKRAMNNKTYEALKSDKHPNISFTLKEAKRLNPAESDSIKLNVTGDLTLAGVTRTVSFDVTGQKTGTGFAFAGEYRLNMKEYKMDPPTAVFGTIRAGEMVTIKFDLKLTGNSR